MKSSKRIILAGSVLYALLAGCTSQIDSTPNPVITDETPNAGGIYFGNITTDGSSTVVPVTAIFDSTQRFVIFSNDQTAMYAGLYSLLSSGISGQARVFSLTTNATTGTASFNGTFESQSAINAAYNFRLSTNTISGPDATGFINLPSYQALIYEKPSATKLLEGTWDNHDGFGYSTTSFTIAGDGTASGSSTTNLCSYYNGKISTINLMYNVYKVEFTESCPSPGAANIIQGLVGLATILPANTDPATPKQLVMAISSAATARLFTLTPAIP